MCASASCETLSFRVLDAKVRACRGLRSMWSASLKFKATIVLEISKRCQEQEFHCHPPLSAPTSPRAVIDLGVIPPSGDVGRSAPKHFPFDFLDMPFGSESYILPNGIPS